MMCAAAATPSGRSGNYAAARTPAFLWTFPREFAMTSLLVKLRIVHQSEPGRANISAILSACEFNGGQVWNDSPLEPLCKNPSHCFAAPLGIVQG